ncbi:hypothetical protein [Ruminococcus sp. YE282]|uniref:hypothetical protein n=1 Tax=Ruminococcus sp. YE282 TaxID=3158780 RepID=UPI00088964F8|nr:hypothetical protein SAMN02910441_00660 [Ruminococcus bromii]
MSINSIKAIFKKQCKDLWKNKAILIQFTLFPFLCLMMTFLIKTEQFTHMFFANLFSTMYIGMTPLSSMNSIIAEEKESGTLSMLRMLRVKSVEYFIGAGSSVFLMCLLVSISFGFVAGYSFSQFIMYIVIESLGIIISMIIGSVIAMFTKNQSAATSIATPIRMMISFFPMISMLNPDIKCYFGFLYTQQINNSLADLSNNEKFFDCLKITSITIVVLVGVFILLYKKNNKQE